MNKILFIGTFLSKVHGTKGIAEKLAENMLTAEIQIKLVSRYENKIIRLLDILVAVLFTKYNLIHIDVFSGSAFQIAKWATNLAYLRKKKIILTLRGGILPVFDQSNSRQIQRLFKKANLIQTPSFYLKDYFEKIGYAVEYLPNSIDTEKFPYNRGTIKPFSILWVRAFTSIYNPDIAVLAFNEVLKIYPNATFTMVGPDKGMLTETQALIKKLGIEKSIRITGPIQNEKLYQYYQTHEVYMNTTSYESFGAAVVEAASCGIPIVSSNVGEIPYLWCHNETMFIVEDIKSTLFAAQIDRIFKNKELAKSVSIQARKKSEEFSWKNIKPLWKEILLN